VGDRELNGYYIIIATAGHDTTSASTAGAIMELAKNPAMFERYRAAEADKAGLIEEAIRWTTPVQHFMRSATEDTEVAGQKISKGDWMMLCYASANRDETVFADPFTFNPDRTPNHQVAFGYGGHVCLGQHLARMEMRILMEELLPRLKSIELCGDPARVESVFVGGLKRLPIRFKAA
jgi:cytochrome P450